MTLDLRLSLWLNFIQLLFASPIILNNIEPNNYICNKYMRIFQFLKHNEKTNKYLEDIAILRLFLIFLLIWNHAFAPFAGHWSPVPNQINIPAYKWMLLIVYHMRIQALIFISGYLLGYISQKKHDALTFNNCVIKKVKRLLLPSIIFSIIYFAIFYDISTPIYKMAYMVINGAGHMWFLPMLFWCFVSIYIAERFKINPILITIFATVTSILPCPTLPLRINNFFTYFIYFYIGFGLNRGYLNWLKPQHSIRPIIICATVYISAFIIHYVLLTDFYEEPFNQKNDLLIKILHQIIGNSLKFLMSISGLLGLFWSTHYFIIGKHKLPEWLISLSTYCYGIYICQQFILRILYYKTALPIIVGSEILPWISMLITLIFSILITEFMLNTKIGRFLIG